MTVYIDENISPYLPRALDALEVRERDRITVLSLQDTFGKGIQDSDLIPELGKQNAVWITRDKKILQKSIELNLILKYDVGVIILRPGKSAKHWDMVLIVINAWLEIREIVNHEKRPFAYRLYSNSKLEKVDRIK